MGKLEVLRVTHYLNQFFGGIGGEDVADTPPQTQEGAVGPGRIVEPLLRGEGVIVSTLVCSFPDGINAAAFLEILEPRNPHTI